MMMTNRDLQTDSPTYHLDVNWLSVRYLVLNCVFFLYFIKCKQHFSIYLKKIEHWCNIDDIVYETGFLDIFEGVANIENHCFTTVGGPV